mmetsp:Transcript_17556/g.28844  ORF Transcript_17556/g.28844 Transcript_17556/m.28844 type:complete len:117 (-) Transcript_17556:488-838(-)
MASLEELKKALKETLESKGVLREIKARIRAEIFTALDETDEPRPTLSDENLLINELIREYMEWNKYRHSLSVFLPETGQPNEKLDRKLIANQLRLADDSNSAKAVTLFNNNTTGGS